MRRSLQDKRPKAHSQTGSTTGEDAETSDVDASESGSLGGRSNATSAGSKKRMTIEEREAAYNEARSRIFMNFEEKEKEMSTSSSTPSLTSGSASTSNGGESVGDEDSGSVNDSEWSGSSHSRDRKDGRRFGNGGPHRGLRSSAPPFNSDMANGVRNSRSSSPSYTYPTLYDPSAPNNYDYPQTNGSAAMGYSQYMYPYAHAEQASAPHFAYPYYSHYTNYSSPQQSMPMDATQAMNNDIYHPHQPVPYPSPYMWSPHPQAPLSGVPVNVQGNPVAQNSPPNFLPPPGTAPQYPYMGQPVYAYPMPGYYTPQPNQALPSPPNMNQPVYSDPSRTVSGYDFIACAISHT
jgi:hypothetical protein